MGDSGILVKPTWRWGRVILAMLLSGSSMWAVAGTRAGREPFELRPGVVVDPARPALYLMRSQGGVEAVEPSTGESLWTSAEAAKPLLLDGDVLIAQAESSGDGRQLRIVGLRARDGERVLDARIALPEGIRASVDGGLGMSFLATARVRGGEVIVAWRFTERPVRGMFEPGNEGGRESSGVVRIEPGTGRVQPATAEDAAAPPDADLPDSIRAMVKSGELRGALWRTNGVVASVGSEPGGRVVLRRWDRHSGRILPEVNLSEGGQLAVRTVSADSRHLLASALAEAGPSSVPQYRWVVFSLETGERLGEVRREEPGAAFCVIGSRLVYESPRSSRTVDGREIEAPITLRAVDLATGAPVWSRPVRDTAHRGPYPPGDQTGLNDAWKSGGA